MFSCEFCEISHNTFFKEPFGRLLLHKHSLCLFSYHDLSPFQKRCRPFFLADYFFGLICRLETKVSSICKTLSQKPIFSIQSYIWDGAFLAKNLTAQHRRYFRKKSSIVDVQPCSKCVSIKCSH